MSCPPPRRRRTRPLFAQNEKDKKDPNVDYEILLRGLRACAERASKPRTTNLDRISKTTKELLERRRALRLDPNASHIERPTGEAPPRIFPSEVRVAIKSMKPGIAPGPDFISADFLRAGHPLHVILAAHMTFYLRKKGSQSSGRPRKPFLSIRKVTERTFGTTVRYAY
ncbi:hypothetical protein RB195_010434 [Necator americanus]|uniref:Uncharacterized protein n=1 Tax=Necator americanus TaxID=51031 RepID=A0ABR1CXW9_NECAM